MKGLRFHEQSWDKPNERGGSWRKGIIGVVLLALVLTLAGLLLRHPFFTIKTVVIDGTVRQNAAELKEFLQGAMSAHRFYLLPENNYFLVSTKELENLLISRYPISHVAFSKEFPNTLRVRVEETVTAVLYDNTAEYAYIGPNGTIVELLRHVADDEWIISRETVTSTVMVTSTNDLGEPILIAQEISEEKEISRTHVPPAKLTNEFGTFPIILDTRGEVILSPESSHAEQVLSPAIIIAVREWERLLEHYASIRIRYIEIRDTSGDLFIKTHETYEIRVRIDDISSQFTALKHLLENEIPKNTFVSYIDLRYKEKLYWR